MRKLKIIEHISLDGVIQTTRGPEDNFPYGDWTAPYRSPARLQIVNEMYGNKCDLLFGCRTAQAVGGDYYDLIDIREGSLAEAGHATGCDRLGIAIGDISGNGMSAALLIASLHASLRGQVLSGAGDLGTKMANVNRLLYDASESNRYATFFYAELDCASRTLHYVNGGHNPPAVLRKGAGAWRVFRLGDGGPVIGLLAGALYKEQMLHLITGDILLAFTDGISEAMNALEDEWGEARMIAEAQAHIDLNAEALMQQLFRAADLFAAGAPQHDDMTIVVLRL